MSAAEGQNPPGMFRALGNPNFRLYFPGQGISLVGTWMQQVALSWLVYRLTGSELLLGLVAFAGQAPSFVIMPFAGAPADRMNRHTLLMISQALAMVQALALAGLTLAGVIEVSHILILGVLAGMISAIELPTRQAFLIELVEKPENLSNAIALNSSLMNAARLVGPALAGVLIAWWGEGICFLINGVSYVAVLLALFALRVRPREKPPEHGSILKHMGEGFRYAFGFAPIRALLLFMAIVSLVGMPYMVLMPVIAKDILDGDAQTLGLLMGASGIGALSGALTLANRKHVLGLGRWITASSAVFSLGLIAFSFSTLFPLSLAIMVITGFGMMIQFGAINIVLQTLVDEDKRGRVMSLYTLSFMGMAPFGSLAAGWLGERIGVPETLLLCGLLCLSAAIAMGTQLPRLRRAARPVYVAKGIISEIPAPVPVRGEDLPEDERQQGKPAG